MQETTTLNADEMARLKAYDRLNAVADILTICVVMFFSYFLPTPLFYQVAIYSLAVFMALFSLLWHSVVPDRFLGRTKLFIKGLVDTLFTTLILQYTGEVQSPFFFLYYLILLAMALCVGVRYTFVIAGVMSMAYIFMSGVAIERLIADPKSFIYIWANVVSLWMVSYLAAVLSEEAEKARRSVEEAKEKVETFSKVDWLTGLFNMKHFDYQAAQELARSERYERPLSLLMLDSDNLKIVNDTYGHQWGDRLITDIAQTAVQQCRLSDTVVRYGGDEFLVLLPETDPVGARFMAERMRAAVEEHGLRVDGRLVKTTVSIGIASFPKDSSDVMGLVARADAALYQSKQAGRNRVTTFTESMMEGEAAPADQQGAEPVPTA